MTNQEKPEYTSWLEELRQSLPPDQFNASWAAGSSLNQAQALELTRQKSSLLG